MPPSVLPSVATPSAAASNGGCALSPAKSHASEPPGSSVAARKLLANSVQRLASSPMRDAGSAAIDQVSLYPDSALEPCRLRVIVCGPRRALGANEQENLCTPANSAGRDRKSARSAWA